jgi:hypothetical protein
VGGAVLNEALERRREEGDEEPKKEGAKNGNSFRRVALPVS